MLDDALRDRLEVEVRQELGEPPQPDLAAVLSRGKYQHRWRTLRMGALGLAMIAGVVAGAIAVSDREQLRPPVGQPPDTTATEDGVAADIIEKLGRLCRSFDFYFKVEIGDALMRPVRCEGDSRTGLGGTTTPASPRLMIYAFSEQAALDLWQQDHPQRLSGRVVGSQWAIDVFDPSEFEAVVEALSDDSGIAFPPNGSWTHGGRSFRAIDGDVSSEVSLQEALEVVVQKGELVGATLVEYDSGTGAFRKAWWIRHRRCIPGYKGMHARPDCVGDETHEIVSADTGKLLDRFVTP